VETEAPPGPSQEREARTTKGGQGPSGDRVKGRSRGHEAKNEGKKSRTDSSRDDARIAREKADEKDLADEESNKRKYIALQNKMEARRIAREIQAAHDTLAALRAEQEVMSPQPTIVYRPSLAIDKAEEGNVPASRKEAKKSRAPRRKVESTGVRVVTKTMRVPKSAISRSQARGTGSVAEPVRAAIAEVVVRVEEDDAMTELLGPALVAGALGQKLGNAPTATMLRVSQNAASKSCRLDRRRKGLCLRLQTIYVTPIALSSTLNWATRGCRYRQPTYTSN